MQPNPANSTAWLLYTVPEGVEQTMLIVSDMTGRVVERSDISGKNGMVELDNENWTTGLYILELVLDDIPAGSVKFVVTD